MASPFMNYGSGSGSNTSITINGIKSNIRGDIKVSLSSLTDVNIVKESLAEGEVLQYTNGKFSNVVPTPSTYPLSQFQPLNQKGQASGYCVLIQTVRYQL